MIGGKTGFTKTSGRTLITAAQKNGTTLICITLDASGDWNDHKTLFDRGFNAVETVTFEKAEIKTEINVAGGQTTLTLVNGEAQSFSVLKGEKVTADTEIPHIIFAPVKAGDKIGIAAFYKNGEKIGEIQLVAEHPVYARNDKESKGFFAWLLNIFK
jgi:D-alanyl-D-alanine carboxypeptidase/D-alanyl-D-alanine carboxypeptidase (penicillin-binding protein 5/6)